MTGGCRNTWQYDTYYQHCWWESFVRTYGEDKRGMSGVDVTEPENKDDTGIRRDAQDSKGAENTDDTAIQQGRKTKMTPEFEKITLRWWVNRIQRKSDN